MLVLLVSAELDASFLITASSVTLVYLTRHDNLFNAPFTHKGFVGFKMKPTLIYPHFLVLPSLFCQTLGDCIFFSLAISFWELTNYNKWQIKNAKLEA
jgi:hypothetical protein